MNTTDKLKLDYDSTMRYFYHLADTRFKLLAFVPSITGVAVTLLAKSALSSTMLGVGIFGWLVSLGIIFYDQRNTQIYDTMVFRAKSLEIMIGLPRLTAHFYPERLRESDKPGEWRRGGPFLDRPPRSLKLLGCCGKSEISDLESSGWLSMWHDGGLALIYSAVMGAWTWLIAFGLAHILVREISSQLPLRISCGSALIVGGFFCWRLYKIDKLRSKGQKLVVPCGDTQSAGEKGCGCEARKVGAERSIAEGLGKEVRLDIYEDNRPD